MPGISEPRPQDLGLGKGGGKGEGGELGTRHQDLERGGGRQIRGLLALRQVCSSYQG